MHGQVRLDLIRKGMKGVEDLTVFKQYEYKRNEKQVVSKFDGRRDGQWKKIKVRVELCEED